MEQLVSSGSGAKAPGQNKKIKKRVRAQARKRSSLTRAQA